MKKNKGLVLVLGGAGFIGSHLVDALIKNNYKVRVLDNLAPPTHNGKLPAWFNKKAEFVKGDVRKRQDLIRAMVGVDFIFHLAAYRINIPRHQSMDISKLKSLGWAPNHFIEENVSEYVDWVRSFPEAKAFFKKSQVSMGKKGIIKV
ncbi:MAG: NAD-dependent epimerase/dehydratase family protein [Patescibacteria group bacterium]